MRTLVEQTRDVLHDALSRLGLDSTVPVHVLMGGADAGDWHLHPERPAVLIGTQDMVLSRALNRGYGIARARWPMDFGLLSQDALWVLDEIQLMGVGFATALQLAAFRNSSPTFRPTYLWSMSATLQPSWFDRSPDTRDFAAALSHQGLQAADLAQPLWVGSQKSLTLLEPGLLAGQLASRILDAHAAISAAIPPLTLIVCNTVERARSLHDALAARLPNSGPELRLLHSRFRGVERATWANLLDSTASTQAGRIIVATQVVEAGVDLSADVLFTEVCPFPSLVQRLGRLARRGGNGKAFIVQVELPRQAAPYDSDALEATLSAIPLLEGGTARELQAFEQSYPKLLDELFPFDPPHLLLREEVHELFDTAADLSGGDIDVSRFIREGDDRDLLVAWVRCARDARGRAAPPPSKLRPSRDSLCAVPFQTARDWLCGKRSKGSEPRHLTKGTSAWVWDWSEGKWRLAERADLRPGAVVLVDTTVGGYDPQRGFDPERRVEVPEVMLIEADLQEQADATMDGESLSATMWQTIAFHGAAVAEQLRAIATSVGLDGCSPDTARLLGLAARWHDLGKAHPAFQGAIRGADRPGRSDLAKAPPEAWRRGRDIYRIGEVPRPGLRHELASALALFDVLVRHAPADHPARLGPWSANATASPPPNRPPNALESEILELNREGFDLVAFLVCSHHGKLRVRLHMGPSDPLTSEGPPPIRGIHEGDLLPSTALAKADGEIELLPERRLTLEPAALGLSPLTGPSWSDRVERLRRTQGPFVLAWLEALLRAADIRASLAKGLVDPTLLAPSLEVAR
jgi:CRISPR-associated endonuclease/helicase Cas3